MRLNRTSAFAAFSVLGGGLFACGHSSTTPSASSDETVGSSAQALSTCSVDSTLGDATTHSAAVAVSRQAGSVDVFYKGGPQDTVRRRILQANKTTWGAEEDQLGGFIGKPGAASWSLHTASADRLDLFVRGMDSGLWHRYYENGTWGNGWEGLGGTLTSSPAVSSWGAGRLDMFYVGTDQALKHRSWDSATPGFTAEENLGGGIKGDPAAVSWGDSRIDVVVRGTDDGLYHNWYDGTWHGYSNLGGSVLASSPTISSWGPNRLDIFFLSAASTLKHRAWGAVGWEDEEDLGGLTAPASGATKYVGDPSAISMSDSRVDVLVNDDKNHLVRRSWYGANARLKPIDCTAGTATAFSGAWRGTMHLEDSGFAAGGGEVALPNFKIPITALAGDASAPPANAQAGLKQTPWVLVSDPSSAITPSGKVLVTSAADFANYTDDYVIPGAHPSDALGDSGAVRARIRVDAANPPAITAGKMTGRFFVDVPVVTLTTAWSSTATTTYATQQWSFVLERIGDLSSATACTTASQCGANAACDTRVGLCVSGTAGQSGTDDAAVSVHHGLAATWPPAVDSMINRAFTAGSNPWNLDPNDRSEGTKNRVRDFYRTLPTSASYDQGVKYSYVVDRASLRNQVHDLGYNLCKRDFTLDRIQATVTETFTPGRWFEGVWPVTKNTPYAGGCTPSGNTGSTITGDLCDAIYNSRSLFDDTGASCAYLANPHYYTPRWRDSFIPCVDGNASDPATKNLGEGPISLNCSTLHDTIDAWDRTSRTYPQFLQSCAESEVLLQIRSDNTYSPYPSRKVYLCDLANALSGEKTLNGTPQYGPNNNWEWIGCWDPTSNGVGPKLFDSNSFGRDFGGDLTVGPVSNDALCVTPAVDAQHPATTHVPYTFPLFSHKDAPGSQQNDPTHAKELLDACAGELAATPNANGNVATVFGAPAQCISTPRFFTSLRDAAGATNLANFNHLVQQWLQMHSFLANQGVQGTELLRALVDDMRTDVAAAGGTAGPLEDATRLLAQLDDGMDLVLDTTVSAKLVAGANAGDYRRTDEYYGVALGTNNDAGANMGIVLDETAKSYLGAIELLIGNVADDVTGRCNDSDVAGKRVALSLRVGRSLRYAAAMSGLADTIAAASDGGHLDGARWDHARRMLSTQRQRVVDKLADVAACRVSAGGENDDVPIYFNDQVTNVSRFFASSEYFRQQAQTEVDTAQRNLDAARGAWIEWRNNHIQWLSQGYDMDRRIEDLERHFGEPILEACGLTNVAPTAVLDAFGGDQGSYAPESCYRPVGVACAPDTTDANCYRGTMGEAALAIVAAQSDVRVATSSWDDARNAYDTQTTYCIQFAKDQATKTNLANKHALTLGDLQTQRLWADSIVTVLGTAKECANLATTVSSYGGTCAGSVNETIAKIVSLNIQRSIDDENSHYQAEMTAFDAAEATKTCFHEADMKKIGIDTARQQIGRRLIEVQANLLKLQNLQRHVRDLVSEGRAARQRERGRKLPSVEFHYWLNEKIDTFRQQFGWAKHVAFLAAKGVEWDYQMSAVGEKKQVMQATTPNMLTTALVSLRAVTQSKQINNKVPGKTEVGVYSLASDILKLGDRTGAKGKDVVGRFRDLMAAPSAVIYDVNGNSLGRGIRFTFPQSLVPGDRCAERLWRVMAAYVGDTVTTDGGKIGMRVAKRNTFSSRWCVGHGAPGTDQVGVTNGLSYFFGGHGTTPVTGGTAWNAASVDAVNSPTKADFANVDFHNGSSEELAGRGLFGDYIVYIPTYELARVNFSNLEDIFLRVDYEDIDNSQIGLKSSIVVKH